MVLNTNKRVMQWFCMHPADETWTKKQKIARVLFPITLLTGGTIVAIGQVTFFVKYVNIELGEAIDSLKNAIGLVFALIIGLIAILMRHKMAILYVQLSDIYRSGSYYSLILYLRN